jgi:hypothetical protein
MITSSKGGLIKNSLAAQIGGTGKISKKKILKLNGSPRDAPNLSHSQNHVIGTSSSMLGAKSLVVSNLNTQGATHSSCTSVENKPLRRLGSQKHTGTLTP